MRVINEMDVVKMDEDIRTMKEDIADLKESLKAFMAETAIIKSHDSLPLKESASGQYPWSKTLSWRQEYHCLINFQDLHCERQP